jgi:hypothetical protein
MRSTTKRNWTGGAGKSYSAGRGLRGIDILQRKFDELYDECETLKAEHAKVTTKHNRLTTNFRAMKKLVSKEISNIVKRAPVV